MNGNIVREIYFYILYVKYTTKEEYEGKIRASKYPHRCMQITCNLAMMKTCLGKEHQFVDGIYRWLSGHLIDILDVISNVLEETKPENH